MDGAGGQQTDSAWGRLPQYTEQIVPTTFAVCITDFDALMGSSLAAKLSVLTHRQTAGACSGASGDCASQAACAVALADSRLVSCLVDGSHTAASARGGGEAPRRHLKTSEGPSAWDIPDNDGQVQPHVRGSANSGDWRCLLCAQLLLGTHPTAKAERLIGSGKLSRASLCWSEPAHITFEPQTPNGRVCQVSLLACWCTGCGLPAGRAALIHNNAGLNSTP